MISNLKLFLFNHTLYFRVDLACAIISENLETAKGIYEKETGNREYEVSEFEIQEGLQIWARGYDNTSVDAYNP